MLRPDDDTHQRWPRWRWSVSLVPGLVAGAAQADDPSCVGKGEFGQIKGGMRSSGWPSSSTARSRSPSSTGGQAADPLVLRLRHLAAGEGREVRYLQPVVGRRTVAGKKLAVYEVAPTPTPTPEPRGGSGSPHPSR